MIKSLQITNLNRRTSGYLDFNDDINIITGKNGSGKTTILKLIWYLTSGNIERAIREIFFDYIFIDTNYFNLSLKREDDDIYFEYVINDETLPAGARSNRDLININSSDFGSDIDIINFATSRKSGSSYFFPTFRRLEGGFGNIASDGEIRKHGLQEYRPEPEIHELQYALHSLSEKLSVYDHKFISSMSTHDINTLLTAKYAEASEEANIKNLNISSHIISMIENLDIDHATERSHDTRSKEVLKRIDKMVRESNDQRNMLFRPFSVLTDLIGRIFEYKGIAIGDNLTLGETKQAISSEILSSGEKQMLSFLVYNAFASKGTIFIDEPELSLHIDWQRILIDTLVDQNTKNQFIFATHSPFIYSKFPEKEIVLNSDRGNNS